MLEESRCCSFMEQRTQSGLGLSQSGDIGPIYLGKACDWTVTHPPASLNNESRLWPPYQPYIEPHPQPLLPTRDYQSPSSPDCSWHLICLILIPTYYCSFKFQNSIPIISRWLYVHYITITSLFVYNLGSLWFLCNFTDEDPHIETFRPLSSLLCYIKVEYILIVNI